MDRNTYVHRLLDLLNAPHTNHNAWTFVSWAQAEGGNAWWNILNTTLPAPGAWDYNSVHVKNYPDAETGLAATARTLEQVNFKPILDSLRASKPPRHTLTAVEKSDWGTGGLALKVLPYVKADYWTYASHTVAGS